MMIEENICKMVKDGGYQSAFGENIIDKGCCKWK